jgi:hypothetical protein
MKVRRQSLRLAVEHRTELSRGGHATKPFDFGGRRGDGRARTGDPLLAKQVLSQLSYIPEWAFLDSNQRPHGYQPCALTN